VLLDPFAHAGRLDPEQAAVDQHSVRHRGIGAALKLQVEDLVVAGEDQISIPSVGVDLGKVEFRGAWLGIGWHSDSEHPAEQGRVGVDDAFRYDVVLIGCRRDCTALPVGKSKRLDG
jgi:hypothetical protein